MRAEDHLTPPTGKNFVVELENEDPQDWGLGN